MPATALTLYAAIALGGALGGGLRSLVGALATAVLGADWPWGTLIVNLGGALIAGLLAGTLQVLGPADPHVEAGLLVGLCGSFTTVSAFSIQSLDLLRDGRRRAAVAYIGLSLGGCLVAAASGVRLAAASLGSA